MQQAAAAHLILALYNRYPPPSRLLCTEPQTQHAHIVPQDSPQLRDLQLQCPLRLKQARLTTGGAPLGPRTPTWP